MKPVAKPAAKPVRIPVLPAKPILHPVPACPAVPTLPAFFQQIVTVPKRYDVSEFGALRYVARQLGLQFTHAGPDYALLDAGIPFDKPVSAATFLQDVGTSYIPGTLTIYGTQRIAVVNRVVK
ncbi:hypothetical protein [Acidithiobacillus caldus]|uniref:hypothetical protein n=1 Tax=Acidithiobacillus caldus TaxID=33059 RepID=UPI00123BA382|nr:hypothetical protein [Acidithiobacillus caldus]